MAMEAEKQYQLNNVVSSHNALRSADGTELANDGSGVVQVSTKKMYPFEEGIRTKFVVKIAPDAAFNIILDHLKATSQGYSAPEASDKKYKLKHTMI